MGQTMIELIDVSDIDTIYRSDIIESAFFLSLDAVHIIKTEQNQKEFLANAQKFKFSKIDEIAFTIADKAKKANIYVQPKNAKSIYLLKEFTVNLFIKESQIRNKNGNAKWMCEVCTFDNKADAMQCEMCTVDRPVYYIK